jgi:hypothetical protein
MATAGSQDRRFMPGGRGVGGVMAIALLWVVWGLARHPGFQPVSVLRVSAPILALVIGAAFTRLVARLRERVDGEREFNPGGKALFMGFVMVTATLLAWLLVSQAIPATLTTVAGVARAEPGQVVRRVPATTDADCRFRLEVSSASAAGGAVQRPLDECVDEALWTQVKDGDAVSLQLVQGALGAELVGVGPAEATR